jgi:hypothetical protein
MQTVIAAYLLGWSPLIVWAALALLLTKGLHR